MAQEDTIRNGGRYDLESHEDKDHALEKIRTAGSISISPELFEKIYLSPQNRVHGDIRRTFGNPTPVAIGGFLLALCPLTNNLLGWRGGGVLGAAEIGNYFFFGGLLMIIGGVLEFILGNTFPFVVFCMFGAFWLSYAATLVPYYHSYIAYEPTKPIQAIDDPTFANSFAFFLVYMGVLCLIFLIASVRTNLVFFLIFACLVPAFGCLAGAFWHLAEGDLAKAQLLQHVGAGLAYAVCILGWYLFAVQILVAVDFPVNLPVVDLSGLVKGGEQLRQAKQQHNTDEEANGVHPPLAQRMKFWKKS